MVKVTFVFSNTNLLRLQWKNYVDNEQLLSKPNIALEQVYLVAFIQLSRKKCLRSIL